MLQTNEKELNSSVLGRLLSEKIAIFHDLNAATSALCESFAAQNFELIKRLIAARGELAAKVDGLDHKIMELNEKLPSYIANLEDSERNLVRTLVRELQDVTKKAVELDNTCTATASTIFENLGADISRVNRERHNFNTYAGQAGKTKILDVKT